jgi:hypothetical protein
MRRHSSPVIFSLLDLRLVRRHLLSGPAIDDERFRPQTPSGADGIHGHVSTTDDRGFLSYLDFLA